MIGLSMTVVDRFRLSGSPSYFMLHQRLVASFINQLNSKCRCIPADDSLKLLRSVEDASQIQGRDKNHWSLTLYLAQFPVELLIISHSCTNCTETAPDTSCHQDHQGLDIGGLPGLALFGSQISRQRKAVRSRFSVTFLVVRLRWS